MTRKSLSIVGGVLVLLAMVSCGGGDGPPTSPTTPAPSPCTQVTAFQGSGPVPAGTAVAQSFSISSSGRLDVTVDWTFPASPIGVFVVPQASCTVAQLNARTCNFVVRSEPGLKPRKVSVTGVAAGAYDLIMANFAVQDESLSALVVLSSSTCPAMAVASLARTQVQPSDMTLTQMIRR